MQHTQKMDLMRELNATLRMIDDQIEEVNKLAQQFGCEPRQVRNHDGSFILTPLAISRAELLVALVHVSNS